MSHEIRSSVHLCKDQAMWVIVFEEAFTPVVAAHAAELPRHWPVARSHLVYLPKQRMTVQTLRLYTMLANTII